MMDLRCPRCGGPICLTVVRVTWSTQVRTAEADCMNSAGCGASWDASGNEIIFS